VEGDVAATIALEELDTALLQEFGRGDNVGGLGVAAESDDGRVFEQEQDVADFAVFAQGDELLLQSKAGGVVDGAELDDGDQDIPATDSRRSKINLFTMEDTEEVHRSFAQNAR